MAILNLQLTAAITAGQVQFGVAATPGNALGSLPAVGSVGLSLPMSIDSEVMFLTGVPATGVVTVRSRGSEGTAAAAHDILAGVAIGLAAGDFPNPPPQQSVMIDPTVDFVVTVGQDGAIAVPVSDTTVNINKASAAALTLAAPSLAINGVQLRITTQTAAAHVVTATALLADGVAGSPHTTATFAALKGSSMTLVAENGLWNVAALQGVTIT